MKKIPKEYIDNYNVTYCLDEHMRNKLNKIFGCNLQAVYTRWLDKSYDKWCVEKDGIRNKTGESSMYILNENGVMYTMDQSEWFSLLEV